MQLETKTLGDFLVVRILESRLGADRATEFKEQVRQYIHEGNRAIVLDLSLVDFLDSTGLGAIVALYKTLAKDGSISVCGVRDSLGRMFQLTRMDRIFQIHPTVEEAVGSFVPGP